MEEDRSAKFSPSKLGCYKECPRRYQYRYVDRIARARKTGATVLGTSAHSAFEFLYERLRAGGRPTLEEVLAEGRAAFTRDWDETVSHLGGASREDWERLLDDCVRRYYAAHAPFENDRTLAVEARVGFPIEVDGHTYRIEGFVDRLAAVGDGDFEIHDYKTAKSLPAQAHLDEDWQLALYEIAVRTQWPAVRSVTLVWHYVRHGQTLRSTRAPEDLARLKAQVAALIGEIKRDHAFEPRPGALCDWCEYRDLCPVFAHAEKLAALPPEERGRDAGALLVGELAVVEDKRHRLKDELKALDRAKEGIDARVAAWAEAAGVTTVAGETAEASVTFKDELRLPTKTGEPERHTALEKDARASAVWDAVARLDAHALVDGVKAGRWTGAAMAAAQDLLERYARRERAATVRLRRRRGETED
ncbi:MAG: PD-(D/E)XK nuclease family protein [Elusimicrobia bacterium]|nr:PD-(D/E)XK nuclease family protein [Elusimicrobiota bacterium]